MPEINKLRRMGRRRFLKTLSSIGVSAAALNHMTKDALAELTDNPSEEIPRLAALRHTNHDAVVAGEEPPELEPVYYTIPKEEFVRVEAPFNAARQLRQHVGDDPQIEIGVRRDESRGELIIQVAHDTLYRSDEEVAKPDISFSRLKEILPDTIDGEVSVRGKTHLVEDILVIPRKSHSTNDDYFDDKYRPVPGGCRHSEGPCTIGHPAYDDDRGEYVWTGAAHCFDRQSGVSVKQPYDWDGSEYYIGDSDKIIPKGDGDAATIMPKWSDTFEKVEYRYAEDDGTYTDWAIYGTRGTDKLKDMAANSEQVYKQGKTTGRLKGAVLMVSDDEQWVTIDCDRDGGDSGGPYFDVNDHGNAYAVGLHKGGKRLRRRWK